MRLKASFGALGVLAFLTMMHVDWDRQRDDSRATDQIEVSRCRSSAKLIETVAHYDFFGTRERDADQSLRRRLLVSQDFTGRTKRFAGQANWHIEWYPCIEPRGAGCRLGGVAALAYVTYTLPRWADRRWPGRRRSCARRDRHPRSSTRRTKRRRARYPRASSVAQIVVARGSAISAQDKGDEERPAKPTMWTAQHGMPLVAALSIRGAMVSRVPVRVQPFE